MSSNSIFSGTSRYSSDFQSILQRSVAIASLPKTQLESQLSALNSRQEALTSLQTKLTDLRSALNNLSSAVTGLSANSLDSSVASVSVSGSAMAGTYFLEVLDIGSYSRSMSLDSLNKVTDPSSQNISSASVFTLNIDGAEFEITPASATLQALADAINTSGAPVEATIVNLGTTAAPDYRLSLQSTTLGNVSIQLNDGSQDLLSTVVSGSEALYKVNGQPAVAISSTSRTVTLAPGLSVTLKKEGMTDITVTHSLSGVQGALTSFAAAYNAALDELDKHRGKDAGALAGSSLVYSLARSLRDLVGYEAGSGTVSSLAQLGMGFDSNGRLTLDQSAFNQAGAAGFTAISEFLGSASGSGFLAYASSLLNSLTDSEDGLVSTELSSIQSQISWQNTRIEQEEDRISQIEQNLNARLTAADALIASLERQATYLNGLFEAMRSLREQL